MCFAEVRILKGIGEKQLKVEISKLNGERFGNLNTETQSTQRSERWTDLGMEVGLASSPSFLPSLLRASRMNMENGSTDFDYC